MGWFLSAMIFQDVVSYIIGQCNIESSDVFIKHQQDDILIIANNEETVKHVMEIVSRKFTEFGFIIKPEKCEGPSDSIVFCGLKLFGDGGIKPWPVKRQLSQVAASTAAELFGRAKNIVETKHVLKSWLGTANYYNK
jgi:hypothetical protein